MKFKYYKVEFEPIDERNIGGTKHNRLVKSIDEEHAIKRAYQIEKWKNDEGHQVYRFTGIIREVE